MLSSNPLIKPWKNQDDYDDHLQTASGLALSSQNNWVDCVKSSLFPGESIDWFPCKLHGIGVNGAPTTCCRNHCLTWRTKQQLWVSLFFISFIYLFLLLQCFLRNLLKSGKPVQSHLCYMTNTNVSISNQCFSLVQAAVVFTFYNISWKLN